ncbi:multidrug efflux MFS transporter [Streptomyces sp. N2-109]|uniref:Multidrug efflux MFS transporter n=1 Tax=Streptomyces gossypii TaxID=2883101 RepID=A0ABT2JN07_9ACTN|nr:MDR family MFS transporter [Streptomyces gossypii]MCT2589260.1 multidrug efflux MFS transporter [Streptomyces gossypii]
MSTDRATSAGTDDSDSRVTPQLWWLSGIMALGSFASLLDSTIVNVAVGPLAEAFDAELATVQWVVTAYLLALSATIPLSGWATARFGAKQTIIAAQLVFLLGSLLSGFAWSAPSLIVFRVVQGIGGGLVVPIGQALLTQAAGPKRLGKLMAVVSVPAMFAPLLGPSLGGLLIDHLGWRWIFFINVPLCLLTLVLVLLRVENAVAPSASAKLDVVGLVLLTPGLAGLLYGLSEAGSAGGFANGRTLGSLTAGLLLLAAFTLRALRDRLNPLLDLSLFRGRSFRYGTLTGFWLSTAMFGVMIPLPLYFQIVQGTSVLGSALLLLPQTLGYLIAVTLMNRLTVLLGVRNLALLGIMLTVAATIPYGLISAQPDMVLLSGAMTVRGFGLGVSMVPTMTLAFGSVPRELAPAATSTFNVFQRVGASVGTAVLAVVLQQRVEDRLPPETATLAQVPPGDGLAATLAPAFGATFWWALAFAVVALIPSLFLPGREPARDCDRPGTPGNVM